MGGGAGAAVRDVMGSSVVSADASLSIGDVARMMEDAGVGAVVITEESRPAGIVTDRDFARAAAHAYQPTAPVRRIMSAPMYSVGPGEPVRAAAELMRRTGAKRLPVAEGGKIVGIITATDLVRMLAVCTEGEMREMYFHSVAGIYGDSSPYG